MKTRLLAPLPFRGGAGVAAAVLVTLACSSGSSNDGGFVDGGDEAAAGCPEIQFPATCPTPAPSWKNEVQGLIVKYCDQCHGNGNSASGQLNLSTYADVAGSARNDWYQIYQCWMPNAGGSPAPMAFPTAAERQTMVTWLDVCMAPDN